MTNAVDAEHKMIPGPRLRTRAEQIADELKSADIRPKLVARATGFATAPDEAGKRRRRLEH
jgi:hypothetical protein